jgi:hypothetical protein
MSKILKKLRLKKKRHDDHVRLIDETDNSEDEFTCVLHIDTITLQCGCKLCQICLDESVAKCYVEGKLPVCPKCNFEL